MRRAERHAAAGRGVAELAAVARDRATRARQPATRDVSVSRETDAMLGNASPRKPSVASASRSSSVAILLVACRDNASASSSRGMPQPSSVTRMSLAPPPSISTVIDARAGVERVLDELLDDGRGPLDDLAGRDLVDELRRQDVDRHCEPLGWRRRVRHAGGPGRVYMNDSTCRRTTRGRGSAAAGS